VEILAQASADFALTQAYNFQGTHILGASRGHLSDSVISLLNNFVKHKLAWSLFYRTLELPELDRIQTSYCVSSMDGLVSMPLFDVSEIDFMLESL